MLDSFARRFLTNGMEFLARFPDRWGIHDGCDGPKVADEGYIEQDCVSVHQQRQELELVCDRRRERRRERKGREKEEKRKRKGREKRERERWDN
jgi:hypothetical protein